MPGASEAIKNFLSGSPKSGVDLIDEEGASHQDSVKVFICGLSVFIIAVLVLVALGLYAYFRVRKL